MNNPNFIKYLPQNRNISKVRYLCICAHQDDAEIMAIDGILKGYCSKKYSFSLIVTCDGGGSSRSGEFTTFSDEQMKKVRIEEQIEASEIGRYNSLYLLGYTSQVAKDKDDERIVQDYIKLIKEIRPEIIYTHSLLDKHPTHIAVSLKVIEAIRKLPKQYRPKKIYGCEVWRSLDWINDDKKVVFNVSRNIRLQKKLLDVFKSQIKGGKSYSDATIGRRKQNATYAKSHNVDSMKLAAFAIDLKPLIDNPNLDIKQFVLCFVDDLRKEIEINL